MLRMRWKFIYFHLPSHHTHCPNPHPYNIFFLLYFSYSKGKKILTNVHVGIRAFLKPSHWTLQGLPQKPLSFTSECVHLSPSQSVPESLTRIFFTASTRWPLLTLGKKCNNPGNTELELKCHSRWTISLQLYSDFIGWRGGGSTDILSRLQGHSYC